MLRSMVFNAAGRDFSGQEREWRIACHRTVRIEDAQHDDLGRTDLRSCSKCRRGDLVTLSQQGPDPADHRQNEKRIGKKWQRR